MGEVSDGYHSFNELYRYRMLYNAAFFNDLAKNEQVEVCKSRRHSDGEKCFGSDDWFIVMAMLPTGQVSNHYESKYWNLFDIPERETAFEYDGHTPNEAADRIEEYLKLKETETGMTFEEALWFLKRGEYIKRRKWDNKYLSFVEHTGRSKYCKETKSHIESIMLIIVDEKNNTASSHNPSTEDILAKDWEIYEPKVEELSK